MRRESIDVRGTFNAAMLSLFKGILILERMEYR